LTPRNVPSSTQRATISRKPFSRSRWCRSHIALAGGHAAMSCISVAESLRAASIAGLRYGSNAWSGGAAAAPLTPCSRTRAR